MSYRKKKNYWQQDIQRFDYVRACVVGSVIILIFSYLFYGSFLWAFLLSPYLIRFLKSWKKQFVKKKRQMFQREFQDAIQSLSAALSVGYSAENAMREAFQDLQILYKKDELILREFRYMIHQLEMNMNIESVWKEFAGRTGEEDVQTFVTVFVLAKRSGGDTVGMIKNAVRQIGEKTEITREIETLLSAKKLEFKVMSAIPFGMICYMKLSFPQFMSVLYGNLAGIVIMSICLVIYMTAYEAGKRMIEIEV